MIAFNKTDGNTNNQCISGDGTITFTIQINVDRLQLNH